MIKKLAYLGALPCLVLIAAAGCTSSTETSAGELAAGSTVGSDVPNIKLTRQVLEPAGLTDCDSRLGQSQAFILRFTLREDNYSHSQYEPRYLDCSKGDRPSCDTGNIDMPIYVNWLDASGLVLESAHSIVRFTRNPSDTFPKWKANIEFPYIAAPGENVRTVAINFPDGFEVSAYENETVRLATFVSGKTKTICIPKKHVEQTPQFEGPQEYSFVTQLDALCSPVQQHYVQANLDRSSSSLGTYSLSATFNNGAADVVCASNCPGRNGSLSHANKTVVTPRGEYVSSLTWKVFASNATELESYDSYIWWYDRTTFEENSVGRDQEGFKTGNPLDYYPSGIAAIYQHDNFCFSAL